MRFPLPSGLTIVLCCLFSLGFYFSSLAQERPAPEDGRLIAVLEFARSDEAANHQLYMIYGWDSGEWVQLSHTRPGYSISMPDWSPNAQQIVVQVTSDDMATTSLFILEVDGTLNRLTDDGGDDTFPAWSPDGEKIAFASDRDGDDFEIYVVDLATQAITQLTDNDTPDLDPDWSLDGEKIVFMSTGPDQDDLEITVMDADGGNLTFLTENDIDDITPAWSPVADQIAFATTIPDGSTDIAIMDADGSNLIVFTNPDRLDRFPAWSPDGEWIAFIGGRFSAETSPPRSPMVLVRPPVDRIDGLTVDGQHLRLLVPQGGFPAWQSAGGDQLDFVTNAGGPDAISLTSAELAHQFLEAADRGGFDTAAPYLCDEPSGLSSYINTWSESDSNVFDITCTTLSSGNAECNFQWDLTLYRMVFGIEDGKICSLRASIILP